MTTPATPFDRQEFLLNVVEQFRQLAVEIGPPFHARADYNGRDAILSIANGQADEALRITARFVDDSDGIDEKLALFWEAHGEVTCLLGLGWTKTAPDPEAGLDSFADHLDSDSVYGIGKVKRALRADIARALRSQTGNMTSAQFSRRQAEFATPIFREPTVRPAERPAAVAREPNIELLQSALGELASQLGLKAETVFANFISATRSPARLKEGDIATYAQGAMVEIALCYDVFLVRRVRASELGMEPLRHAVATAKAILFERDEPMRYQLARQMVAAMRLYYAEALASRGVAPADAKEILRSTFGRDAVIASNAITFFSQPGAPKRSVLTHFLAAETLSDDTYVENTRFYSGINILIFVYRHVTYARCSTANAAAMAILNRRSMTLSACRKVSRALWSESGTCPSMMEGSPTIANWLGAHGVWLEASIAEGV